MTSCDSQTTLIHRLNALHRIMFGVIVAVAGTIVTAMLLHIVIDVVFREFIGFQIFATIDIVSNYYMVAVTYLCIALAQIRGDHIEMSMVMSMLSERVQKIGLLLGSALAALMYGCMTYIGAAEAIVKFRAGTYVVVGSGRMDIWPAFWLLPIGFAAMVFVTITTTILRFRIGLDYQTLTEEAS